jgi:hypothetical protein
VDPRIEEAHSSVPRYEPRTLAVTEFPPEDIDPSLEADYSLQEDFSELLFLLTTKQKRAHKFQEIEDNLEQTDSEEDEPSCGSEDEDEEEDDDEGDELEEDEEYRARTERFDAPELSEDEPFEDPPVDFQKPSLHVALLILEYQARFRLSDVAADALVKIMREILRDAEQS